MPVLLNPHRFGSAAPFSPSDLATLTAWYDPSDTANRTVVSSAFSALTNKQGTTARNLQQPTAGDRPALATAQIGGRDAMDFDGINDSLWHNAANLYAAGAATVACIVLAPLQNDRHIISETLIASEPIWTIFYSQATNSNGAPDSFIWVSGGDIRYPGYSDGTGVVFGGSAHVLVITDSGTNITHWVDGVQSSSHAYTRATMTVDGFTLGGIRVIGNIFGLFDGYMGEVVCCTSVLGTSDRQKLEGYMAHRWGTTGALDAGHPYKSVAP